MRDLELKKRRAFNSTVANDAESGGDSAAGEQSQSEQAVLAFDAEEGDIVPDADADADASDPDDAAKSRRSLLERCRLVRWFSRKLLSRRMRASGGRSSIRSRGGAGGNGITVGDAEAEQLMSLLPWMVPRTRPRPLRELSASSGLSVQLLRRLYAKFKQECPNGLMQRESFQEICGYFFPLGEASLYAGLLFDSFLTLPPAHGSDKQLRLRPPQTDRLCFEQLVAVMSRLSRGSLQDKLHWLFALYDADKDGEISRRDLLTVVTGVYSLCGSACKPAVLPNVTAAEVSERLFQCMDADCDGTVSWADFSAYLTEKLRPTAADLADFEAEEEVGNQAAEGGGETNRHLSFLMEMDPLSQI